MRVGRAYNSTAAANAARVTVPMGVGWHMFYDRGVESLSGTQVRLHRANGQALDFAWNGSGWNSVRPAGTLLSTGSGWQYTNHRNTVENYDSQGRLTSLSSGGLVTTLQYNASGRLTAAVNPFGRTLQYGYDAAGRINAITLPGGGALNYTYDARGNLASVRFMDGSIRQYLYENVSFPNALTGIVDESGRRRVTWGYDAAGRPNDTYYGNGTGRVMVSYNGSQVTTTDALGVQRIRNFSSVAGRQVLASISTLATTAGWMA